MPYYWFHAFNRDTIQDVVSVLRNGPEINPRPDCRTRQNEDLLDIVPACVYAYLGLKRTGFLGDLISWEDGVYGTSESVFTGGA